MASINCASCLGKHQSVQGVKDCYADYAAMEAEAQAEQYAEAISSWVSGGGSYQDAQVYARVIASGKTWDQYLRELDEEFATRAEAAGTCEHGLSAALCEGPQHYPMDM